MGMDAIFMKGALACFQFLSPPGIPGISPGSVTNTPASTGGSCWMKISMQCTDRQTGILCWMCLGSLLPPAAQRYIRISKRLHSVNFQQLPVPRGNTYQEHVEMSAQSGKELSSSACTDVPFPGKGIWGTGVNAKKQRTPCPSASCW